MSDCRFGRPECVTGRMCARCRVAIAMEEEAALRSQLDDARADTETANRDGAPPENDPPEYAPPENAVPEPEPETETETEEFLVLDLDPDDELTYALDQPVEIDISARFEYPEAPRDAEPVVHMLLELTPSGPALVEGFDGPASHVILALDVSASMNAPGKFPLLLEALRRMLYDLQDPDSPEVLVSVVVFAMGARRIIDAVPAKMLDPRDLEATLRASPLLFGRYTDVEGALRRAGRIAFDSHIANRRLPLRIVLLTDGQPQDVASAAAAMSTLEKVPVDVDCLAFGEDADVLTMKRLICGRRGGTVKHVDGDTIGDAFARIAEVAQTVVAKRSLVDIELVGGVVGGEVWRHRPGRHAFGRGAFDMGVRFGTDLGTLQRGRTYSLVVQLRLPRTTAAETEIGRVVVRLPGEGGALIFERALSLQRCEGSALPTADGDVRNAVEIVSGSDSADIQKVLASLVARRELHAAEQRSERLVQLLDRAIEAVRRTGSLDGLSKAEFAALAAHTRTVVSGAGSSTGQR